MIYLDPPRPFPRKRKKYSHMMADTLIELHAFAESLSIKRCHFDRDHYDVNEDQFHMAVLSGAEVVRPRDLIKLRIK